MTPRTQQDIFNDIITEKEATPALAGLTSSSSASVWQQIFFIIAYAISVFENILASFETEVQAIADEAAPLTVAWYLSMCFKFQYGYKLVFNSNNVPAYTVADTTALIINQAAVIENLTAGTIAIKVATLSGGVLAALSSDELTGFTGYINKIQGAGDRITITSLNADSLAMSGTIYYDGELNPSATLTAIQTALQTYIDSITFNGNFSVLQAQIAILNVPGINDMQIQFYAKASGGAYAPIKVDPTATTNTAEYAPSSGYFVLDTTTYSPTLSPQ